MQSIGQKTTLQRVTSQSDQVNGLLQSAILMKHLRIGFFSNGLQAVNRAGSTAKIENPPRRQGELTGLRTWGAVTIGGEACAARVAFKLEKATW